MAVWAIPLIDTDHAHNAVQKALEIEAAIRKLYPRSAASSSQPKLLWNYSISKSHGNLARHAWLFFF